MTRRFAPTLFVLALLASASAAAADGCADLGGLSITHGVLWQDVWDALDQSSSCTQNCHVGSTPAAELDFSNRELAIYFLVGQPSSQSAGILRVEPGAPTRSLLFQKVACEEPDVGHRMPPGGHVPQALMELIFDWIEQGARGENPEDPIPRVFLFRDSLESLRCVIDGRTVDHANCRVTPEDLGRIAAEERRRRRGLPPCENCPIP